MSLAARADQAQALRDLVRAAPVDRRDVPRTSAPGVAAQRARRATTLAIASGKGGVGKTTLAVNLALSLADLDVATILLDGDLGLANADLLLNAVPRRHLGHAIEGGVGVDDLLTPVSPRLHLVAGGSGLAHMADMGPLERGRLLAIAGQLEARARALVIDCGAGIGAGVLDLLQASNHGLIVATPEPPAVADAYGLIKALVRRATGAHPGLWLVVNQAGDAVEAQEVHARMAAVCARFLGVPLGLAGWIPLDREVGKAVRARQPLVVRAPKSAAAGSVRALAVRVKSDMVGAVGAEASGQGAPGADGLVARLLRIMRPGGAVPASRG